MSEALNIIEATPRDGGGAAMENEDGSGKPEAYRTVLRQSRHSIRHRHLKLSSFPSGISYVQARMVFFAKRTM